MVYRLTKRILDLVISGSLLILFAPVMAVVAVAVRIKLGSPILFRHPRPGYEEKIFDCIKFRTMTNSRDAKGALLPEIQRITEFGKFLRRTSLDELPQLWTVLTGDMSLVGPRPLEIRYLPRYSAEQRRRHSVPPGITGWAQINGRNEIEWDRKFELDLWYVNHRSVWLDLKIMVLTFWKVVSATGIAKAGTTSMEEFMGPRTASTQEVH
ncbi:MAG: sugar transferase [Acidobacteria bacterium]|nr:sugar transferase [Acidobacteriota bacterium]